MSEEAFDDAIASVSDLAAALLSAPHMGGRKSRSQALASIVVAVADARGRRPGDDGILADLDRARAAFVKLTERGISKDDEALPLGPALERARDLALDRAARAPVRAEERSDWPSPMVASRGSAALHRDVLLSAAPEPAKPRAFGALTPRTEAPSDESLTAKTLRRWARDALEELAIAGRLRRPREDEPWTSGLAFEQRALDALDALASLGRGATAEERTDIAQAIESSLSEWSIPDPGRVFAATFALGCFEGHGAAARLQVKARTADPRVRPAVEDALALGSSPQIDDVVVSLLCEDEKPDLLLLGLSVARRRRRAPTALVVPLLAHPEPRVAITAAQACFRLDPATVRSPLHEALLGPPDLAAHAAEALLIAPSARLSARLTELSEGDPNEESTVRAARLRIHSAEPRDVEPLLALCGRLPRAACLELCGWLGSAAACDLLVRALDETDWSHREIAAWSLSRITGAGLDRIGTVETDEKGNPIHDPDAPGAPSWPEEADRSVRHPPIDPAFWAEPVRKAQSVSFPRLRFGQPISAQAVLNELSDPRSTNRARRFLLTELVALTGEPPLPLDVDDWIARQKETLALARSARGGAP